MLSSSASHTKIQKWRPSTFRLTGKVSPFKTTIQVICDFFFHCLCISTPGFGTAPISTSHAALTGNNPQKCNTTKGVQCGGLGFPEKHRHANRLQANAGHGERYHGVCPGPHPPTYLTRTPVGLPKSKRSRQATYFTVFLTHSYSNKKNSLLGSLLRGGGCQSLVIITSYCHCITL